MIPKTPRLAGLAALIALLLPLAAAAQEVKIGFVDREKALFSTEQGKKARAELQSKVTAAKSQLQPMADEIQKLQTELEAKKFVLSQEALRDMQAKMLELQNRYESKGKELENQLKIDQAKLAAKSNEQIATLNGVMLEWTGLMARDIEGFEVAAFTRDAKLTFDVLQKAISLRQIVETKGVDLPYRDALLTELTARIDGASGADVSAQTARVAVQVKQRETRELSARFHKELVSFRRTLRAALGSSHIDYQRLRVTGRTAVEPPPSEQSEAASAVTSNGASRPSVAS